MLYIFVVTTKVCSQENYSDKTEILESIEIDSVPADFPVSFSSLSHNNWQFVAYYNKNRNLTVASRKVSDDQWNYKILPTKVGWDTHNQIIIDYSHKNRGDGELIVDLESLSLIGDREVEVVEKLEYPKQLMQVNRSEEGVNVHWMKLKSTDPNSD